MLIQFFIPSRKLALGACDDEVLAERVCCGDEGDVGLITPGAALRWSHEEASVRAFSGVDANESSNATCGFNDGYSAIGRAVTGPC